MPEYKMSGASQYAHPTFASKGALDIEGLGEKNVESLLASGLITDAADLYSLTQEKVIELERFAEVSARKLVEAITNKKYPTLAKFIFALGIRHVGVQTAIDLAAEFRSLEALSIATVEELNAVEGVGVVVAESIVAWFSDIENQRLLQKFKAAGVTPEVMAKLQPGPLTGKSFVITGSLETMSREEAADNIRGLGGSFQTSVGKGTTYLVAGGSVGASKLTKAEKFGTEVIDEAMLKKILQS